MSAADMNEANADMSDKHTQTGMPDTHLESSQESSEKLH